MLRLRLSAGEEVVSNLLDEKIVHFVIPASLPPLDLAQAYSEALKKPIGCPILSDDEFRRPAIIFADNTRTCSPFVPLLVKALAKTDDLKMICASGTHKPPSEEHLKAVLGDEFKRFRSSIYISTHKVGCSFEPIGATTRGTPVELNSELLDRDLIISTLNVQPHYFAGYEGGCKALLPGCSSLKTILANHGRAIGNPRAKELIIDGNDVREDIDEVGSLLEQARGIRYRILDFTMNSNGSLVKAMYGRPPKAHRLLAEGYARRIWAVEAEPARLVVAVADGPLGLNLYQSLKAATYAANLASPGLKPKSRLLILASLKDGVGGEAFAYEMERYGRWEASKIIEDLKQRAKAGDITEASQKPNTFAADDAKTDFNFVSPNAPVEVEKLLAKTKYGFFRSIDEAIMNMPRELLSAVAVIPYSSGTVPVPKPV
jgi:nickel-dependent lactate racemase